MKRKIDGIIVVEGKTDVAFLNEFIEAEFVITNGSEISEETINYLIKASKKRDVFVLTDPDSPGKRIRDILDSKIDNLKHCFVSKEQSIKNGKVGVAESTKEEVIHALEHAFQTNKNAIGSITMSELYSLGLVGSQESETKRLNVSKKMNLGYCNAKTFLKRLNNNCVNIEEVKKLLWTKINFTKQLEVIN